MFDWLKFMSGTVPTQRLTASSVAELWSSLQQLRSGERGWITFSEVRLLFSPMDSAYAVGEMDEQGRANLAAFAAEYRSDLDFAPGEARVYLTRKSN